MIRWTPTALRDLESLHTYIFEDQPGAADATVDNILAGIRALAQHPEMGRSARVRGTRELVISPFLVAYKVKNGAVEIVAIIHGARRWPDSF
jgi:addiction module RelE/StbE family toxin